MRRQTWLLGLLVALHLLGAARVALTSDWTVPDFATGDNLRYREIATAPGLPYRDHAVEYPPLTWAFVTVLHRAGDLEVTGPLLVATQLVADLAVAAALAAGWDRRAAVAWLALLLPLVWEGWIFGRVDLLSVALALGGLALARRRREVGGGVLVALGALAKAWPVVTVPGFLVERRPRALRAAVVTVAAGGIAWVAVGGIGGVRDVLSFRGATGWQVESSVGSIELLDASRLTTTQAGALRIGTQPGWARVALAVALVAGIALAWWLARRATAVATTSAAEAVVLADLAAVGLLLVLSPLLSPQFLVWLVPFVALRWWDHAAVAITGAALVLTALVARNYGQLLNHGTGWGLLVLVRNGLLVALVVLAFARLAALRRAPAVVAAGVSGPDAACTARRTRR